MATPSEAPMSMTRGASFLPGRMKPEEQAQHRREIADLRWKRTSDRDDVYRRRKGSK